MKLIIASLEVEEEELQFDFTPVTFFSVTGQGWVRETTFLPETSARYGGCAEGHGQGELQR